MISTINVDTFKFYDKDLNDSSLQGYGWILMLDLEIHDTKV